MVRLAGLTLLLACLAGSAIATSPAGLLAQAPQVSAFTLDAPEAREGHAYAEGEFTLADPYGETPLLTRFKLYLADTREPAPLVLVLTPYRGETFADSGYAEALAARGLHAALVAVPKDAYRQDADIDYIDRFFVRHTLNVLALKHALLEHPASPIRVSRVGLLGSSLGAIRASILFGADRQFASAVLIMPGGDLAKLIARTALQPIAQWREKFLFPELQDDPFALPPEPLESDLHAFEQQLRPHIHIDPLDFVRPRSASQILFVRSESDSFVPRQNQDRLFAAYRDTSQQAPEEIPGSSLGHYATIIAVYNSDKDRIVDFLRRKLAN